MQHTTKAANSPSTKTKIKKTDGYLLYDTIICLRISTILRDTVEGEEKNFMLKLINPRSNYKTVVCSSVKERQSDDLKQQIK